MRRMRDRRWRSWIAPLLILAARPVWAQGPPIPPAIPDNLAPMPSTLNLEMTSTPSMPIPESPGGQAGTPINLATAMQLAGVRPLDIAAATAGVEQSLGLLIQARALKLPTLSGGVDYLRHDGNAQNIFTGQLFQKGTNYLFLGGGPTLSVSAADAIFAPLAARRVVASRRADVQAARNNSVFNVAQAYFAVQEARGRLGGIEATSAKAEQLVGLTRQLAPGLVSPLEYNRALAEALSLKQDIENARRDWRVASARLMEILLLDPNLVLEPIEPPFLRVELIADCESIESLLPVAQANRPELASQRSLLAAANLNLRREKSRPFVPNILLSSPATATGLLSAGTVYAGPNGASNYGGGRADFNVAAVWELQGLGIGNLGLIKQAKGVQDSATVELTRTVYRVHSEVSQALARLQTAKARVPLAEEELRQAVTSADRNFEGLRQTARPAGELLRLVVRPQEVVAAIIAMESAYQQLYQAINDANLAQFELYRALGQPAQWVNARLASGPPPTSPVPGSTLRNGGLGPPVPIMPR
jgi:outer membrane protein TolC